MSFSYNERKVNNFIETTLTISVFFLNICNKYATFSNNIQQKRM